MINKIFFFIFVFILFSTLSCFDFDIDNDYQQCTDGSRCCKTENGVQIVGITVPLECECPKNTTYLFTDKKFNVKQCDCNDCD